MSGLVASFRFFGGVQQTAETLAPLRGVAHRKLSSGDVDGAPLDRIPTRGSWPSVDHHLRHSKVRLALWADSSPGTRDVPTVGLDPWRRPTEEGAEEGARVGGRLFLCLVTLMAGFDRRAR